MRLGGSASRRLADFTILSAMRSGSNNLQDTLNQHPEIECGGEVLNPGHLQIRGKVYLHLEGGPLQRAGLKAAMAVARYAKRRHPAMMLRIARRPGSDRIFGFRVFGDHITYFGLHALLDELHAQGTRFIHLVRRDTFDQALSLVRAESTGVWRIPVGATARAAPVDLLGLADRVKSAAERLQRHKVITANVARQYGAMLLDYEEYMRDERSYERVQEFLGVRTRVALRHTNQKSPPVDTAAYHRLREELERLGAPMRFDPEAT